MGEKKVVKKSIFRAIFVPLIIIMVIQSMIFYVAAVYGAVQRSLNQNAADILSERLTNRKNEVETKFNVNWADLSFCEEQINSIYKDFENQYGDKPLAYDKKQQVNFLSDSTDILIDTLRKNQVNGVFLIINDKKEKVDVNKDTSDKYGLSFFDMDQTSAYKNREDLLLERSPSSLIAQTECSLDTWWEATYSFNNEKESSYYFSPLNAAWDNIGAKSDDLAYYCGSHYLYDPTQTFVSYSIPLIDSNGYPYAVLGIELSTKFLSTLIPASELSPDNSACYMLAIRNVNDTDYTPIAYNGSFYNRCFTNNEIISCANVQNTGGFLINNANGVNVYGVESVFEIYNSNNPFEDDQICLVALVDENELFKYSNQVKTTLLTASFVCLLIGAAAILVISRRFASPITSLAERARKAKPQTDIQLGHVNIEEIDQLVDSIETLSKNASKQIARTDFFSRMSHDMRTPMNAIISFSSPELLENADEIKKDNYLEKIHNSGEYLLGLINEVLDMTKIESNKVDLSRSEISTTKLFSAVTPMISKLAQQKNINFISDIDNSKTFCVLADEQHINQIIINLLSNAVKFTGENGTVTLKSRLEYSDSDKFIDCKIEVSDNGIGIGKDFQEKMFTPFEQESSTKGGTGLGLSICRKLVTLMDGTIDFTSEKGKGTTFFVTIPLEIIDIDTQTNNIDYNKELVIDDSVLAGKRILLCEDHPLNTQIAVKLLQRKNIIVDTAENGRIGVDKFKESQIGTYNAVLMDIRMPILDGLGAAAAIRKLEREDAKSVPIIAMTANAFEEDVQKSRSVGMNAHLSKPVEPDLLYSTLTTMLK